MARLGDYAFGRLTVDGAEHTRDLIVLPDRVVGDWWRKGHSHIDESEIWLMRFGAKPSYEQISEGGAKEVWPMWSKDGRTIYSSGFDGEIHFWEAPPLAEIDLPTKSTPVQTRPPRSNELR